MTTAASSSKVRDIVSNLMIFLPSLILLASSFAMFAHVPALVAQMAALGFDGSRLIIIAVLALASAVLFTVPRTRGLGLLFLSAFLGGAMATHLGHGESPVPPGAFLAAIWTGMWLKGEIPVAEG